LNVRFDIYSNSFSYISKNFFGLLWGKDYLSFASIGYLLQSMSGLGGGSLESQFLSILYLNGFIGLFLFLRFLKQIYFNKLSSKSSKIFMKLLSLNIMLTSLTLGGIFLIYTYPIMTILYLYIKNTNSFLELNKKAQIKGVEYV